MLLRVGCEIVWIRSKFAETSAYQCGIATPLIECFFIIFCRNAEASCVSQILTAQAVAAAMGKGRAAACGVDTWASCHLQNSERDVQRTLKTQIQARYPSVICYQQWMQSSLDFTGVMAAVHCHKRPLAHDGGL